MDRRVEAFRREAARIKSRGTGRRYPVAVRTLAVEYARAQIAKGASTAAIAAELGIPGQTLTYWFSKETSEATLLPVRVVARSEREPAAEDATVRVLTPEGLVIAGLTTRNVSTSSRHRRLKIYEGSEVADAAPPVSLSTPGRAMCGAGLRRSVGSLRVHVSSGALRAFSTGTRASSRTSGLMWTTLGGRRATGRPRTKRSGWASKAASRVRWRAAASSSTRPK